MRFSESKLSQIATEDFTIRKHYPSVLQIVFIFSIYFCIMVSAGFFLGWGIAFIAATLVMAVGMALFTIISIQHNRDLLLVAEFENTLFSSGLTMHHKFTLISNREGVIVYMDRGFQSMFPSISRNQQQALDMMMEIGQVARDDAEKIFIAIAQRLQERMVFSMTGKDGIPQKIILSIEPLNRPGGFVLLRGREFVDNRLGAGDALIMSTGKGSPLMTHIVNNLPVGVYGTDAQGIIEFANHKLEDLLGYNYGELASLKLSLSNLIDHSTGSFALDNFEGEVHIRSRTGATIRTYITQFRVSGNSHGGGGLTAMVYPLGEGDQLRETHQPSSSTAIVHHEPTTSGIPLENYIATSPIAIARIDHRGFIVDANDAFQQLTQQTLRERLPYRLVELLATEKREELETVVREALGGHVVLQGHALEFVLPNGSNVMISLYFSLSQSAEGPQLLAHIIDTTEQKNLELRFAHSQKMQAVGQLAGGVAHDFNNLLTAMIGFCDLLLMRHPAGDQSFADIMQIKQNANRAANLVRQLLAFSRRQTLQPKMLDITDVLAELSNLVRRLIGENIELKINHGRDLGMVKADQGQLEQVIINLAVNARDAMPNGGTLTVSSSKVTVNRKNPVPRDLFAPSEEDSAIADGEYVLVEVSDTGTGIPRDIVQKIFEPFFSTKEIGSGTGLGLSTVYGIIKQTGGYVFVASAEGKGTRFAIYFPSQQPQEGSTETEEETSEKASGVDLTGKATILLVEDETPVRIFAARALRNKGYTVLEADSGEAALEIIGQHGNEIEVIITDVIMPGMNGPSMIEQILPLHPNVKVIFISGYAEDALKTYGTDRNFNFLPKPFTLKQLASKVKEVTQGK